MWRMVQCHGFHAREDNENSTVHIIRHKVFYLHRVKECI